MSDTAPHTPAAKATSKDESAVVSTTPMGSPITPRNSQTSPKGPITQSTPGGNDPDSLDSNNSLGLDRAAYQDLYPSIQKDVGFDVTDVPQAMIDAAKTMGVKIPPANPSQVKRERKSDEEVELEDDFSKEKYRHTVANHTTFLQGICRLPFSIFECPNFLDYIKSSGLDFASKVPDLAEIQKGLEMRKMAYPEYLARSIAHHVELAAALKTSKKEQKTRQKTKEEEVEKARGEENEEEERDEDLERSKKSQAIPVESTKSLAAIWRQPLEDWQVTFPIIKPTPVSVSNRSTNAAAAKTRAETLRRSKATPAAASSASKQTKLSFPMPAGYTAPTPVDPPADANQSSKDTIVYGCDAKDLPPPVVQYLGRALRFVFTAFISALDSIAGEKDELNALLDGAKRESRSKQNLSKKPYGVSPDSEKEAFRALFGDWVVREEFGSLEWADRPPSVNIAVPGYLEAIKVVNTAFRASFKSRDDSRYDAILKVDNDTVKHIIPVLEADDFINGMTRQDVRNWLDTMISAELKYIHLNTSPIPRFSSVMSAFLKKCNHYDLLSNQEWNRLDDEERKRHWAIRQGLDALEQERKETMENMALDTGFESYSFAKAINFNKNSPADADESSVEALGMDDLLAEADYGVEPFQGMDSWELIQGLGLVDFQPPEQRLLAESMDKDEAHRRIQDLEGKPKRNQGGEWMWVNPKEHHARMDVRFPGLNWLNSEPRNRNEWDSYVDECVKDGTTPVRSEHTHEPIYPSVHQLMGVSNIIARNYLDPKYAPHHSHTLLMDDVGVGKTLQFLMVITVLDYYRRVLKGTPKKTPTSCPAVMQPWKKQWSIGRKADDSEELVDLTQDHISENLSVEWIGDRIMKQYINSTRNRQRFSETSPITPSLILASPTIQQSHLAEFTRFLDTSRFVCLTFPKGFRSKPSLHADFVKLVEKKVAAGFHVIISMTYEEASHVSSRVTVEQETDDQSKADYKDKLRRSTILKNEWLFDVLIMDEVHVLRNRESDRCKAIQRLSRKGLTVIGATATGLWNSPEDIIGEAAAMCHGKVVSSLDQELATTGNPFAWIDGVSTVWDEIRKLRAQTERNVSRRKEKQSIRHSDSAKGQIAAQAEILAKQAEWLGPIEDEGSAQGKDLDQLRIRNSFREKLKNGVARPILFHLQSYILRRLKSSKDLFGDSIVEMPPFEERKLILELNRNEQTAYDHWSNKLSQTKNPKAQNFQILARKYNLDPHFATTGWYNPTIAPSRKMRRIIKTCREWDEENLDDVEQKTKKGVNDQTKLVIHTLWTSQIQVLQARLAKAGFFCKVLSGDTPQALRQGIISDFQRDEDHMSDPVAYYDADNKLVLFESRPCRILIITSVGSSGITLHRANRMIMVDQFFTHQEYIQAMGRIVRKGQTRPCIIYIITVEGTCDDWMSNVAGSKGMAASTLFGRGGHTARLYEEGADILPGQEVLETPADALEAMNRIAIKVEKNAKKNREKDAEKGLVTKKPVSPKVESGKGEGSGKRERDEEEEDKGAAAKKPRDDVTQATPGDLMDRDRQDDAQDMESQSTQL